MKQRFICVVEHCIAEATHSYRRVCASCYGKLARQGRLGELEQFPRRDARTLRMQARVASGQKQCTRCGEVKSLDAFYRRSPPAGDGYMATCKQCHNAVTTQLHGIRWRNDPALRERHRKYSRRKAHHE